MSVLSSIRRRRYSTKSVMSWGTLASSGTLSTSGKGISKDLLRKLSWAFKKEGRRASRRGSGNQGLLIVTHQNQPETVILSVERYQVLVRMTLRDEVRDALQLAELRARFDQRLASLNGPHAHKALDAFMDAQK